MKRFLLPAAIACGVLSTLGVAILPDSFTGASSPLPAAPAAIDLQTEGNAKTSEIIKKAPRAAAASVKIVPDTTSGIYGANYTYTDPDGNVFGYHVDWRVDYDDYYYYSGEHYDEETGNWVANESTFEGEYYLQNAKFCGVKTNEQSIEIPVNLAIDSIIPQMRDYYYYGDQLVIPTSMTNEASIEQIDFRHDITNDGIETSFPVPEGVENHELTDIYIPEQVTRVSWSGKFQTDARNFHFRSESVPSLQLDNDANGKITIYVPDSLYFSYKHYINSNYTNYTLLVRSEEPLTPVYVNVSEPGTLAVEIVKLVENLESVRWVVVTGTPNEEDLRLFRRMPHLEILDLSQATGLKEVSGLNGLEYLRTVNLPNNVEIIGTSAFEGCRSLESINMPTNLKHLKNHVFKDCRSLQSINFYEGLTEIGESAFENATALDSISLPSSLTTIRERAFYNTRITEINLENVRSIYDYAFQYSHISYANLTNVQYIGHWAFANTPLASVNFSNTLNQVEYGAFHNANLSEVTLPASLQNIGGDHDSWAPFSNNSNLKKIIVENSPYVSNWNKYTFYGTRPDTIIWKPLFPEAENKFGDNACFENATLFVPKLTYSNYLLSDAWAGCKDVRPMEEDLDYIYLDRDFTLLSEEGITSDATFEIGGKLWNSDWDWDYEQSSNQYGSLTVRRKTDLQLGKFTLNGYMSYSGYDYWYEDSQASMGYRGATVIPKSKVSADETEINFTLNTRRWNFITLPFDVNVKDIEVEDETLWVVRRYSGEDRANLTGNTWVNVAENETLKAGQGYIFHCAKEGRSDVKFTFRPAESGDGLFNTANMETALESHPSEFAHNAHWNLVGNPYPAYVTLRALDFDSPVTIWNGSTYNAYSPIDDEYAFSPFQAFFVQLQEIEGGDVLKLDERGRAHSYSAALEIEIEDDAPAEAKRKARKMESRMVLDLSLASEKMSDRTRLVINEAASTGYESNRDAAKFMSTENGAAQIFMVNDGQRMAIDERPMGEGVYALGTSFASSGSYTISLAARNFEGYVALLTDNKTNQTVDIAAAPYEFKADAGTDEGRFTLRLVRGIPSDVEEMAAAGISISAEGNVLSVTAPEEVAIIVAAADGKVVAAAQSASYSVELPAGVYVVKAGESVKKINIR